MRIVHAVRSDGFSGVERHIVTLATEQARAGHHVAVIGGDTSRMGVALAGTSVQASSGTTVREVIDEVRHHRGADIVHAHMTAGELASTVSATSPIVVTRHFARRRGTTLVGRLSGRFIESRVIAQIAVSHFVASKIDGSSSVVYAGVDAQEEVTTKREPVVLVAQRLAAEKCTRDALSAFAASGLARQGWRLEVAGRGSERNALVAYSAELGLTDSISFVGFLDDLSERMRRVSLVLATAPAEPYGLTVVEAMAHGNAVVASKSGGHLETVGRADRSFLYEPGDVDQAGKFLAWLAGDDELRQSYGNELMSLQRDLFTPTRQYTHTQAVYEAVLSR